ncbi:EF-hand domain-containing protein 1 [Eumeta japonica]|uniref:EF-hand domain-containing protein 1 n=1 Tax=Eumeta variegata TaxID=151549 RepID=A0A4C1YV74_EUMVA|nr:EF-hand domain-containing protein 1 [Eumeta japonica]
MLNIDQPTAIDFRQKPPEQKPKIVMCSQPLPPHIYIGSPEDTLQSCFGMIPKPPHKDLIKAAVNMNKVSPLPIHRVDNF